MIRIAREADEASSLHLTQRIDEACDRFEDAWKAGRRPRIEGYLGAVPAPGAEELLRQLLAVDLVYRARGGERPSPREYQKRFPGQPALIESIFSELGMIAEDARPRPP